MRFLSSLLSFSEVGSFLQVVGLVVCLLFNCSLSHGRLFEYLCTKAQFDESLAACFIHQLLDALQYLHNCYIAHLDIKVCCSLIPKWWPGAFVYIYRASGLVNVYSANATCFNLAITLMLTRITGSNGKKITLNMQRQQHDWNWPHNGIRAQGPNIISWCCSGQNVAWNLQSLLVTAQHLDFWVVVVFQYFVAAIVTADREVPRFTSASNYPDYYIWETWKKPVNTRWMEIIHFTPT